MNRNFLYLLPLLLVATVFVSCSKNDDEVLDINTQSVSTVASEDSWKVIYFYDHDDGNETSKFNGYNFTFVAAGDLTASHSGINKTGIWLVKQDEGRTKLELNFNDDDNPLYELDEDWVVTELTPNRIKLEDLDDADDDDIEYLIIHKM